MRNLLFGVLTLLCYLEEPARIQTVAFREKPLEIPQETIRTDTLMQKPYHHH